jgi:prepilin peptidase CpaA
MTQCSLLLVVAASAIATITDLRTRTIPNWLTLPLPALALLLHGLHAGTAGLLFSALGVVACFLPVYFLFARGALGGGDVKLLAGFGGLVGARDGLELELAAFSLLAVFALLATALRGRLWPLLTASARATLHLLAPRRFARPDASRDGVELPMGLAIFCATLALLARSYV